MKKLLFAVLILLCSCQKYYTVSKPEFQKALEEAYFDGQRDAINWDVRIRLGKDSIYFWIKSPWNCGKEPLFVPTYLNSKKQ